MGKLALQPKIDQTSPKTVKNNIHPVAKNKPPKGDVCTTSVPRCTSRQGAEFDSNSENSSHESSGLV